MGRRGPDDEKWAEIKHRVYKRDKGRCRLLRIISAKEAVILKKKAGIKMTKIDAAHIFPVSLYPWMVYEINDLVCLNRYSHEMLDSHRDPITGEPISAEKVVEWWKKIAGARQWEALTNIINHKLGVFDGEENRETREVS